MIFVMIRSPRRIATLSGGSSKSIVSGATSAGEMNRRKMKAPRAVNFASGQTSALRGTKGKAVNICPPYG